jgi:hypothetical protein
LLKESVTGLDELATLPDELINIERNLFAGRNCALLSWFLGNFACKESAMKRLSIDNIKVGDPAPQAPHP